jgi:hypothetical protein
VSQEAVILILASPFAVAALMGLLQEVWYQIRKENR